MRTQITRVIVAVTAATVLVLGIPLAIMVLRFYDQGATVRLQRRAALAVGEVTLPLDAPTITQALSEPDDPAGVTVYDATGGRLTGPGPARSDAPTIRALSGTPTVARENGQLVVTTPISERVTERVVGAVRVTTPTATILWRAARAWLVMGAASAVTLLGAWLAARRQAARLARPVAMLADQAHQLGDGRVASQPLTTGVAELDEVSSALSRSSTRLVELLGRERALSSAMSHQLRTPLARLKIIVEQTKDAHPETTTSLDQASSELDGLDTTIDHLVALARDELMPGARCDARQAVTAAHARWQKAFERSARRFELTVDQTAPVIPASRGGLDQVLDVIIDNALRHGRGDVHARVRAVAGGTAIEIADQGELSHTLPRSDRVQGGAGGHHGLGLTLAGAIVEAEGGRLQHISSRPTTFQVVYPAADRDVR